MLVLAHDQGLNEIVNRADSWPDAAQEELAQLAREVEAELKAGAYRTSMRNLPASIEVSGIRPKAGSSPTTRSR